VKSAIEELLDLLQQSKESVKDLSCCLEVGFPFSIPAMDISHQFITENMEEVKNYVFEKLGICVNRVFVFTGFESVDKKEYKNVSLDSKTLLKVFKKEDEYIAILILTGNLKRK
jgi:hypothetical protein